MGGLDLKISMALESVEMKSLFRVTVARSLSSDFPLIAAVFLKPTIPLMRLVLSHFPSGCITRFVFKYIRSDFL